MTPTFIETLLQTAHYTSKQVKPRSKVKVYLHMLSEMGEIGEEANIACGELYKPQGKDGVIGEAADVINCLADFLWVCAAPMTDMVSIRREISSRAGIEDFNDPVIPVGDIQGARQFFAETTRCLAEIHPAMNDQKLVQQPRFLENCAWIMRSVLYLAKAEDPSLTEKQFMAIFRAKCEKWLEKAS